MGERQYKRFDRTMHVAEYIYTKKVVEPFLPVLSRTWITPNMITIFNSFFALLIFYLAYKEQYLILGFFIQLYLFLDILDGNLARYKNLKSKFGAVLDNINDRIFYSFIFIFIGIGEVPSLLIGSVVILINFYALLATFYIVPRLRLLPRVERKGIKKFFIKRGFIIGMDTGTVALITTGFLLLNEIEKLYYVLIVGFLVDIVVRLLELWRNEKLYS